MNRNLGLSAGTVALLALALHVSTPTGPEKGSNEPEAAAGGGSAKKKTIEGQGPGVGTDKKLEGPWLATRRFFGASESFRTPQLANREIDFTRTDEILQCAGAAGCSSLLPAFFGIQGRDSEYDVQFLLATIPDPLHTRVALFTDSSIQAIQKAADILGWEFAAQWLPWNDTVDPEEKEPAKRREERQDIRDQEKQPGVLVFRPKLDDKKDIPSFQRVLLVFLIGETPTSGVNPAQFQIARAYIRAIREPAKIRILGPTFSGSFYSLARLIEKDKGRNRANAAPAEYSVRSGTATNAAAASAFQHWTGADFNDTTASSADQAEYFRRTLSDLNIDPNDAAVLTEDESGYGGAVQRLASGNDIRVFRFPRDIAHLRNAYREAVQSSKEKSPTPDLEFSLKDTGIGEDSVPTFSPAHSPLSQNAVLNEIMGAIRRDRIRIVQISASNVFDILFLARVLKRQCPDTRLLVSNADLLFAEAAQTDRLTGILAMSTYPLFFASNQWVDGSQRLLPAIHPDSNSEGVFNAAVLSLSSERDDWRPDALNDYHWKALRRPPVWLLTLDKEGFSPVRLWEPHLNSGERESWFEPVPGGQTVSLRLPSPPPVWMVVVASLALLSIALTIWIVCLVAQPTLLVDARFSIAPGNQDDRWRGFYLFTFFLILAAMQILICLALWRVDPDEIVRLQFLPLLGATLAICLAACVFYQNAVWKMGRVAIAFSCALILVVAGLSLWFYCCYHSKPPFQSFFFSVRATELRAGSSPMWPILSCAAALLIYSFVHLTRLYFVAFQQPDIISRQMQASLQQRLEKAHAEFNASLASVFGFWTIEQEKWFGLVLLAGLGFGGLLRAHAQLTSIDTPYYDFLCVALLALVILMLIASCWQIAVLWRRLQSFLVSLGILPLANAFVPVERASGQRPIWVRRLNMQSLDIQISSVMLLHDMSLLPSELAGPRKEEWWFDSYRERVSALLALDLPGTRQPKTRDEMLSQYGALRSLNYQIASELFEGAIKSQWASEALVGEAHASQPPKEKAQDEKANGAAAPTLEIPGNPKKFGDLAQTFVALHFSSFLMYGVRQIRNLMWLPSLGFVLLMIALNSYSFQSPQRIGRFLMLLFAVVAIVLWRCLSGMERDPILSRMAGTTPGQLSSEFYLKLVSYVGLPVLGLLASEFPSISNFLFSWIQPTLEALH